MFTHPRIKANLTRASVDGDKLFLYDEGRQTLLEDRAAAAIAPLLDGTRPLDELLAEVGEIPFAQVLAALTKLERSVIVDGPGTGDPAVDAWWIARCGSLARGECRAAVSLTALGDAPGAGLATLARGHRAADGGFGRGGRRLWRPKV